MALINCPECGKEISDKAASCIHCGCPIQPRQHAYRAEMPTASEIVIQNDPVRMSQKQTIGVIVLVAISVFLPLVLSRSGLYNFRLISFVLSLIPCVAVALLAVFQPKKKELLCAIALTFSAAISFIVPQFLYRDPSTIIGLLNYVVLFSLIIIYWLSAVPVINNRNVPIFATIGYAVFALIRVLIASTYGRNMLGIRFVSVICDIAFFSSGCIIISDSMKHRQRKEKGSAAGNGSYIYVQDAPSTGYAILCFCFPIVGLILYCVWREPLPKRAKSAGMGGLLGFIIETILTVVIYGMMMA